MAVCLTEAQLHKLFGTDSVDEVVWTDRIDDHEAARGATHVDVVLHSTPGLIRRERKVALVWCDAPGGLIAKGVQTMTLGVPLTFRNVVVRRGGILGVAAENPWGPEGPPSVQVEILRAGTAPAPASSSSSGEDPLTSGAKEVGKGLGTVLGIGLLAFIGYQLFLRKVLR